MGGKRGGVGGGRAAVGAALGGGARWSTGGSASAPGAWPGARAPRPLAPGRGGRPGCKRRTAPEARAAAATATRNALEVCTLASPVDVGLRARARRRCDAAGGPPASPPKIIDAVAAAGGGPHRRQGEGAKTPATHAVIKVT